MIVSAHTGGVLVPDLLVAKRQHLKALREDHERLQDRHRFLLAPAGEGTVTIRHVRFGRFVEPLRKAEGSAVYDNIRFQGPVLLEDEQLRESRNRWEIRRRGDFCQIGLAGTAYVLGLTHPDHTDSWVTLLDPWWSMDRLWLVHDLPDVQA
ncbi:hypothetical protein GCM10022227_32500 [Streptomyces sedi]